MFDITELVKSVPNRDSSWEQIEYIPLEKLLPDPDNFYSMAGIEELAANIETAGLQQPLRVYVNPESPECYTILSGHRRNSALQLLAKDDPEKWGMVSCIVERDNVPIEARKLRLLLANRDTRKLTSADLDRQASDMERYIVALKDQGYRFPGRLSDYVAQCLSTSKTKLNRLKIIREGLIPEWRKMWEDGKINDSVGYALGHLEKELQGTMADIYRSVPNVLTSQFVESIQPRLASIPERCVLCSSDGCTNRSALKSRILSVFRMERACPGCCAKCEQKKSCLNCCAEVKKRIKPSGGSAEDKLEALAEEYRLKEQKRMENLSRLAERFVKEHLNQGRLEDFILEAVYRNDVVEAFKRTVCATHSGGSSLDGIDYGFSPRGVQLKDEKGRGECTIVEFTDAVMVAALKLCIKNYGADTAPKATGWKTGTPEEDGEYLIAYGANIYSARFYSDATYTEAEGWVLLGSPISEYDYHVFAWCELPGKEKRNDLSL